MTFPSLALFAAASLCAGIVCSSAGETAGIDLGAHNAVPNPSFESGDIWPDAWSQQRREGGDRAQFNWDDRIAHSGRRSVAVYSQPIHETCWGAWLCQVPVRGGIKWYFSGWMKSEGMTYGGLVGWLWDGGTPIRGDFAAASGTHDWRQGEWIVDVPEARTYLTAGLEFRRANGKAWADDLLAVPYCLKLTADLLADSERLSLHPLPPGVEEEFAEWRDALTNLSLEVVDWRRASVEQLKEYQDRASELRSTLAGIEDRIAVARFSEPLVAGYYAPVRSLYRRPAEWSPDDFGQAVHIETMRGETESFQLALLATRDDMNAVRVALDAPTDTSGRRISPEQLMVHRVEYVEYDTASAEHGNLWPDVLVPSSEFNLVKHEAQPVWVDLEVPRDQCPGTYEGRIRIEGPGGIRLEKPLVVRVHASVLPRPTRMKAAMTTVPDYRLQRTEDRERIALARVAFLARHHIRPHLKFQTVDFMLKAYKMVREDFGFRWLGTEGLDENDWQRLYETAVAESWVDGLCCNVWDEPPGAEAVPRYREFKAKYPLAKTLLTLADHRTAIREYQEVVDIWCPDPTNWGLDPDFHRSRKYRWHYFCLDGGITDPTMWRQATGTRAWEMGVEGFFYWCAIATSASYHNREGKWVIVDRCAGDGGIVYPDPRSPIELYASIRLKLLRDGVEDWELLRCLQESARDCDRRDLRIRADELLLLKREPSEPYPRFIRRVREEAFGLIESIGGTTRNR